MSAIQTIAIIGAMEAEIEHLKSCLVNKKTHQFGVGFCVYTGKIGNQNIVLSLSGIGKVNAAIATTLVIEHFQPDCVINTGSAGGLDAELNIGDVVIGATCAHHDVDATAFGYARGQVPQMPARFDGVADLIQAATRAAAAFHGAKVVQGLIVSGDSFIHRQAQRDMILQHFPDAKAVEMEAAAIAQTCAQWRKPFVIIRAISDGANEAAHISFEEFLAIAAQHSAQMVLRLVEALSPDSSGSL